MLVRARAAAIESHVEHCASCAALMTRERQLSQGLRALAAATAADGPLGRTRTPAAGGVCRAAVDAAAGGGVGAAAGWMRAAAAVLLTGAAAAWWWSARSEPAAESPTTRTQCAQTLRSLNRHLRRVWP